jgi:hypothetical protein
MAKIKLKATIGHNYKPGDIVTPVNTVGGHNYVVGTRYRVLSAQSEGSIYAESLDGNFKGNCLAATQLMLIPIDKEFCQTQIKELIKKIEYFKDQENLIDELGIALSPIEMDMVNKMKSHGIEITKELVADLFKK